MIIMNVLAIVLGSFPWSARADEWVQLFGSEQLRGVCDFEDPRDDKTSGILELSKFKIINHKDFNDQNSKF